MIPSEVASHAFDARGVEMHAQEIKAAKQRAATLKCSISAKYTDANYLFVIRTVVPRAETSLRDIRRSRGTLGIRNSRNPSARVNGPPLLPPAHRATFRRPQSRARSILLLCATAATRSNSFFEHRAKQVFNVSRETTRRRGGERGQTGR